MFTPLVYILGSIVFVLMFLELVQELNCKLLCASVCQSLLDGLELSQLACLLALVTQQFFL